MELGGIQYHQDSDRTVYYLRGCDQTDHEGSDYLTEQVRLYTMTGEKQYMDNYFKEKETGKKREASLESVKKNLAKQKCIM